MRKALSLFVFALGLVIGIAGPAIGENRLIPAMGISQADADARYLLKTGGTIGGDLLVTGTLEVDTHATLGESVGSIMTCNAGTWTWPNVTTFNFDAATILNFDAATTFDATGQSPQMKATTWDFTVATNVTVPDANAVTEAMNQQTADARYVEVAGDTVTGDFAVDGKTTLGNAGGDTVLSNVYAWTWPNGAYFNFDNPTTLDATGQTVAVKGTTWDFATNTTNVTVPDADAATEAINQQVGDARYALASAIPTLKSGTVAGGSFAGNPKIYTVTFGTAFPDTNYAVTMAGVDNRAFTFQTKLAASFVINTNANLALTGDVDWTATAHYDP